MINKNTFLRDHEERSFVQETEFLNFLNERTLSDEWATMPSEFVSIRGVENAPIAVPTLIPDIKGYEGTEDGLKEAMEEYGLLLSFFDSDKQSFRCLPLREIAISSLFERAGLSGRILREQGETSIPSEKKAEWLSYALKHWDKQECRLLLRDGKISTCRSAKYVPLDTVSLIKTTYNALPDECHFENASVTHEMTSVELTYGSEQGDMEVMDDIHNMFGITATEVRRYVKFYTSDTGDAAATLIPYLEVDGCPLPLGNPFKMVHSRGASIGKWEKLLGGVSAMFREAMNTMKNLYVSLTDPASVLRYGACEVGLPKAPSLKFAKEWEAELAANPGSVTAYDVFRKLSELIEKVEANTHPNLGSKLRVRENVARFITQKFSDVDFHFEWE